MNTSLYTGATGMKSYGVGMSSISNNIANINTVAFKNAMMLYSDHISQTVNSAHGNGITEISQLGMGVSVNVNRTMHQQGPFEQGSSPTDLAISGKGFFGVERDGLIEYTRAGNFRFTAGELVDPNGYALLAYRVTNGIAENAVEPVAMDFGASGQGYMQPKATTAVNLVENLGDRASKNNDEANPFFSLATDWNGTQSPPLSESQYGHSTPLTVYDAQGNVQVLNAYYDFAGNFDGKQVYQYVMGTDPSVDGSANAGTAGAGLLAAGTITFSSSGQIQDMTMFTPPSGGNTSDLSAWAPAGFDAAGNPAFTAVFGKAGAQNISINLGMEMNATWSGSYANAAEVNANPEQLYAGQERALLQSSSTSFIGGSGTASSSQDGYAPGYLEDLSIDRDGMMAGKYSNGQSVDLFQIPVYRFINEEGLRHEGGNHYTDTTESGSAEIGLPNTENYGGIHEATLEQSNVDLATEFTSMIVTQRGFQMNSKAVTTSDQMLQKALELKR